MYNQNFDPRQPVHTYLELSSFNNDTLPGDAPAPLNFTDTRTEPFIYNPSSYFVSIVRFRLDTVSLPIFIPQVVIGQTDVNKLIYQISILAADGTLVTMNVNYLASNALLSVNIPLTQQDLTNQYYFIYNMRDWVNMLNITLANICTTLAITDAPFFDFDISTSLFKLYVPQNFATYAEGIYLDKQLYSLLATFSYDYEYIPNTTIPAYRLYAEDRNGLNHATINSIDYYVMEQEVSTLNIYNPVKSIVFNVFNVSIMNTNVSPAYVFGHATTNSGITSESNKMPIISDFEVNVSDLKNGYKNGIMYTPTAEYRLFDLQSSTPFYSITVKCQWKDVFGNLHIFILSPGCSAGMMLMFRRKDYNSLSLELK